MTTTTTAAQEPWAAMCAAQTTATSHANVQQGVQYMTDELRAGQNAAKGRQQAAPTSSRGRQACINPWREATMQVCSQSKNIGLRVTGVQGALNTRDQNTGSTFS